MLDGLGRDRCAAGARSGRAGIGVRGDADPCRPGADPEAIAAWEERHGYRLPAGLRAWLMLSNGLYRSGPLIHPISAIGPMIPFARVPDMIVQPESWFELGNPNLQTICIDLAYRLPGGGFPIFTSGDDQSAASRGSSPAASRNGSSSCCGKGGANTGSTPALSISATPGSRIAAMSPHPCLSGRLRPFAERVARLIQSGADEREDRLESRPEPRRRRVDLPPSPTRQPRTGHDESLTVVQRTTDK